ncbi:MAG: tetratricopeptide repeat protein [Candidatus Binatia bacterium]
MKIRLIAFSFVWLLAGCTSLRVGGHFQSGRQALLRNEPEQALAYFLEVAKDDPDYVYQSMYFREGIWTYVGRTQYAGGRLKEARQSLEQALAQDPNDHMARLYLGLTLMRSDEYERGLKELATAMRGLHDWLEYTERTRPLQAYWDPGREIRSAIEKELERIKARDIAREELIANAEWLGKRMEEEIDRARRDERRQWENDFDNRRGPSVGIGLGF